MESALWQLTLARIREFMREPSVVFWTFGFPVLLAIGLGIAFRNKPQESYRIAIVGEHFQTKAIYEILEDNRLYEIQQLSLNKALYALNRAKLDVVVIPTMVDGHYQFTYHYDPAQPQGTAAQLSLDQTLQRALGRQDVATISTKTASAPGGRYIDFLIPGLIGLNVMSSSLWGIGYTIVLARKRKLLKRLAATPMKRSHYMIAYMLSRLIFLISEVALLVFFGKLVFDVPVIGSLLALTLVSIVGAMSFMGMALLVAARTESTEVASGLMNAAMLPMYILSGSFFSYERFPEIIHPLIKLLPLTAFNDAFRSIMIDGASLIQIWSPLLIMALWGILGVVLAQRLFRWQ